MTDTSQRYLETLGAIPRYPRKTTASEIHSRLIAAGYQIDRRSVERDLQSLSRKYGISCDEGTRPKGWFWQKDAAGLTAPGTTTGEALELELLARYLKPILPASSWATLEPRLAAARATLNTVPNAPLSRWRTRVAVIDDGQPLLAPKVSPEVQDCVHEALLRNRRLDIDYLAVDSNERKRYEVHPVALVHQGRVGYLVAMLFDYTDLRLLAIHRMSKPAVRDVTARQAANFKLQSYLQESLDFGFPTGREWRLQLRVSEWLARHLSERQLAENQTITKIEDDDQFLVRATVPESERLIWWLRSHGGEVEVIKPKALRTRLANEFAGLAARYDRST